MRRMSIATLKTAEPLEGRYRRRLREEGRKLYHYREDLSMLIIFLKKAFRIHEVCAIHPSLRCFEHEEELGRVFRYERGI